MNNDVCPIRLEGVSATEPREAKLWLRSQMQVRCSEHVVGIDDHYVELLDLDVGKMWRKTHWWCMDIAMYINQICSKTPLLIMMALIYAYLQSYFIGKHEVIPPQAFLNPSALNKWEYKYQSERLPSNHVKRPWNEIKSQQVKQTAARSAWQKWKLVFQHIIPQETAASE